MKGSPESEVISYQTFNRSVIENFHGYSTKLYWLDRKLGRSGVKAVSFL